MKEVFWSPVKSERLKKSRGMSFEELIQARLVAVKRHPSRTHQQAMLFDYKGYIWVVPFVENRRRYLLEDPVSQPKVYAAVSQGRAVMRESRLGKSERAIEGALLRGEYVDVSKATLHEVAQAIARRRKDAVISIRVNSQDLKQIKGKAKQLGIGYQTLIAEVLHRVVA